MTDQPAPAKANIHPAIFYLICVLLIGTFLWRMTITAQEYPPRMALYLELVIDAAMIVGLIGIRKSGPQALFIAALICGIGLFAIRLHSDASWWTGHWHYVFDKR
jgi:hypothetical protein